MWRTILKRSLLPVAWLAAVAVLATSCQPVVSDQVGDDGPGSLVRSSKQRNLSPEVATADLERQVAGNSRFAFDFYQQMRTLSQGNLFFSPYSISIALAMTWAGARTTTETQMTEALSLELGQDRLHQAFNWLDLELNGRGTGAQGMDGQGFRLNVVNAIWGQQGYAFLPPFLDVLAENYGAGLRLLDFAGAPDESRLAINDWVEQQTESRIPDLLPPGSISILTRLVLSNAIYFNAAWKSKFATELTTQADFTRLDGQVVQVPMMHQTTSLRYLVADTFAAVELPYDGEELSMLVLLPDVFESFDAALDAEGVRAIVDSMESGEVILSMPRWKFASDSLSLRQLLSALGMPVAFVDREADFSGMDGQPYFLFIADVIHKAFVAVNEAGTESAAATAVIMAGSGMPQGVEIALDRPFIYLIRDIPTGAILFVGRVVDPSAEQ
ncbi:MAG: serpin family protein [Deltaproteobacteria bacterium]|nr:serpin family protein [Deltaproteobacteria bacterium]